MINDPTTKVQAEVSVIVPARNEEACLAACLESLVGQRGVEYEVIVVDDHSTDATRQIAERFAVQVVPADPLPPGWTGKCNAAWTGARAAKGKWLLFTDADTRHASDSIAAGVREAEENGAGLLSYSPKQEVHSLAERALMPVIFAELAATYPPPKVCDPASAVAAANGQYLLIRRDVYDAIGGHAAVAAEILEDVELAKRVKQAGYKLSFRQSDVVSTRMYRSFPQMWEGWTKNMALLFPDPRTLALARFLEFLLIATWPAFIGLAWLHGQTIGSAVGAVCATIFLLPFVKRIRRAHFDWISRTLAIFGLPLFAALLVNSAKAHRRAAVNWKGREYVGRTSGACSSLQTPAGSLREFQRQNWSFGSLVVDLLTGVVAIIPLEWAFALFHEPGVGFQTAAFFCAFFPGFMLGAWRAHSSGPIWLKSTLITLPYLLVGVTVSGGLRSLHNIGAMLFQAAAVSVPAAVGLWCKRQCDMSGTRLQRNR